MNGRIVLHEVISIMKANRSPVTSLVLQGAMWQSWVYIVRKDYINLRMENKLQATISSPFKERYSEDKNSEYFSEKKY